MQEDNMTNQQLLEAIREIVSTGLAKYATKDDLKAFATKDDLKAFVTKDDLKAFATKDDLKAFVTKDDLKRLEHKLERKIESSQRSNIQHHLITREAIGHLNKKVADIQEAWPRPLA